MDRRLFLKTAVASVAGVACSPAVGAEKPVCRRSCDVIVVGGGPAGVCAAIAAARNGAKTLVVARCAR